MNAEERIKELEAENERLKKELQEAIWDFPPCLVHPIPGIPTEPLHLFGGQDKQDEKENYKL